ncbi:DNA polymerase III subunit delta [Sulfuricystis multivorans]|uniref:DNA polymerase III subunit delta n=1 Tax=Sulfuricystis multivorans TaxID=2211108 RepID=UPI001559B18C|nr:DNA polymerase III subunit delta [Sulfuricystis multivorans]
MILRPEQLHAHLEKPLQPLYVLHGDEPLLTTEAGDLLRAAARRQGYTDRTVLVVTPSFKWEELFHAAGNLSLFGGRAFIDLRIPTGKPGRDGAEALQRYARALPAETITLITLPEMDWRARKAAWFAALAGVGVVIEGNAPPVAMLPQWISRRLAAQGQSASAEALEFIALNVEGNLLAAHQEIQKLGLLYPPGELSLQQVSAAVLNVARYDIDDLKNALQAKDAARAARTLEGLKAEDAAPPLVLWVLATEARSRAQRAAASVPPSQSQPPRGSASGVAHGRSAPACGGSPSAVRAAASVPPSQSQPPRGSASGVAHGRSAPACGGSPSAVRAAASVPPSQSQPPRGSASGVAHGRSAPAYGGSPSAVRAAASVPPSQSEPPGGSASGVAHGRSAPAYGGSPSAVRAALLHAARIDRIIKGLSSGDVWDEFLQLALRLTRA